MTPSLISPRLRRLLLPLAAILALALLVACGSSATEAPEPAATPAPQETATTEALPQGTTAPSQGQGATAVPAAAPATTPAPVSSSSGGGEAQGQLVLGLTGYGNEVPIPWQEIAFAKNYGRFIWDYLVGTTDDAQLSTDTGLAVSWAMVEDGLSWNFKLREGVLFHNGEEFTSEDMKFALDKTMIIPEAPASYKELINDN